MSEEKGPGGAISLPRGGDVEAAGFDVINYQTSVNRRRTEAARQQRERLDKLRHFWRIVLWWGMLAAAWFVTGWAAAAWAIPPRTVVHIQIALAACTGFWVRSAIGLFWPETK